MFTLGVPWECFAHDTWLIPQPPLISQPQTTAQQLVLVPGTGDFFPRPDFLTPSDRIEATQCLQAGRPLKHDLQINPVLGFQIELSPKQTTGPTFCTIKLKREYIELDLDKVPLYLDDISASPRLRGGWAKLQSQALPWKENYTKTARVELGETLSTQASTQASNQTNKPFGQHAEVLSAQPGQKLAPGQSAQFVLLHRGKPRAHQPVEWINSEGEQRGWLKTNAKGIVSVPIGTPGLWMLRGTVIKLGANQQFESDFFTLVFRVRQ